MATPTPVAWLGSHLVTCDEVIVAAMKAKGFIFFELFTTDQLRQARADALREAAEPVADIYCHAVGHPGTAIAFQEVVMTMLRHMADEIEKGEAE